MDVSNRPNNLLKKLSSTRAFYEQVAKTKGDTDVYWAPGFYQSLLIQEINKILHNVKRKRIIDVGCGDGRTTLFLAKRKNSVIGIDIAKTRLLRARQKTANYNTNTLFVQAYVEALPIKSGTFDGVVCLEVLEHVMNDDILLNAIATVLKPNAWVLMSVPTVSLSRYFEMLYSKRLIYFDPIEHVREFTYFRVPFFKKDFLLIKDLVNKASFFGLTLKKRYGVGFELPLGIRRFRIGQYFEKFYRKREVNRFIMKLPFIKYFGVYTILVLQKTENDSDLKEHI